MPKSSMLSRTPSAFNSANTSSARSSVAHGDGFGNLQLQGTWVEFGLFQNQSDFGGQFGLCELFGVMFTLMLSGGSDGNCDCQARTGGSLPALVYGSWEV